MTLAVRFSCIFAVAFVMVPRLHADGTVTPNVKQHESAITVVAPTVSAEAKTEPSAALTVPAQSTIGERSQAGSNAGPVGAIHRWYDTKNDISSGVQCLRHSAIVWANCTVEDGFVVHTFQISPDQNSDVAKVQAQPAS